MKLFVLVLVTAFVVAVKGHGRVMDPVNRASAWRKGFDTEPDYDDDGHMCGMNKYTVDKVPKSCGPCGVPHFPKDGPIVKTYKAGQKVDIAVEFTADHAGYMWFRLCPQTSVTEQCFEQHKLKVLNSPRDTGHDDRYDWLKKEIGTKHVQVQLPQGLTCEHCVLQWHWQTHNNWKYASEVWRQCSDIKIQ